MARVLLKSLTKVFDGKVTAVKNVTLDIPDGEFMVIVGPSGCGKTTILRMIASLEESTSGTITIGDTVVNDISPRERDIAMVFQNYALYPHMTVFQNMAFGLKLRKYPKAEIKKRVENAAKLLRIEQLLERKPNALSGGQRQRVAVGRAIVRNPKVFLFDEPLSNLDAQVRISTRAELKALHHKLDTTSIYVTHDQDEAMTLGDRICVLYNGVVQQAGSPLQVYEQPANRFVAGFLGIPPMNFFNGRIELGQNLPKFVMGDTEITLPKRLNDNLAAYKGKEMVLGIRPEHLSPAPIEGQSGNRIPATVGVIEPLGDRMDVCLTGSCGQKFIANIGPHIKIETDDSVIMHVDIERVHIFEQGEIGKNIGLQ